MQCVHAADVAEAYRLAATTDVHGAFNIAADPVLDPGTLARTLKARRVDGPRAPAADRRRPQLPRPPAARARPAGSTWAWPSRRWTRRAPAPSSGWTPRHTSTEALLELLEGMRDPVGAPTPPLEPHAGGPARVKEFATGVGSKLG